MMPSRQGLLAFAGCLILLGCDVKPEPGAPAKAAAEAAEPSGATRPEEAAQQGIRTLRDIITRQNFKEMGFDTLEEVQRAQLDRPLTIHEIRLDELSRFPAGGDVETLLRKSRETLYPVAVDRAVKSALWVVQEPRGYFPAEYGNAELIRAIARHRATDDTLVRVPGLHLSFLARRGGDGLTLTLPYPDDRLQLAVGTPTPADVVIRQLKPLATEQVAYSSGP